MPRSEIPEAAISRLRSVLDGIRGPGGSPEDEAARQILEERDTVLARFGQVFAPDQIARLRAEDFLEFLRFKNNRHWEGLHRRGPQITSDIKRLRATIGQLVDESQPIARRFDRAHDGDAKIPFLGRAILTAVLLVTFPRKYAVWNTKSEAGMRALGIWPDADGASRGELYARMNEVCLATAAALGTDLWTLDMLWWRVTKNDGRQASVQQLAPTDVESMPSVDPSTFALETHLHEFLVENWENTALGREWDLLEQDGETVGSHFQTSEVGEIDLLARHKSDARWLVVELKRNQSSDATVGQILRYMSWVREKLAEPGDVVEGIIVCRTADMKLKYALAGLDRIRCMSYEVTFSLRATTWPRGH